MRKILFTILVVILLSFFSVFAQDNHENKIEEGKNLVQSSIDCNDLTEEQLEAIGEYYMEQMHPGEAHEIMDNMMGGEGSESLRQVHINMAKRVYCNDKIYIGYGMMSGGMMNGYNMPYQGMMNNYNYGAYGYSWNVFGVLYFFLLLGLIIIVALVIIKLLKGNIKKW
ncbi:hypothetical protein HYV88_01005 [Candidatus Woesearchaeota archaeon]|nr:hypothetical protein [Candidatus Woesearchaeota archaeon]